MAEWLEERLGAGAVVVTREPGDWPGGDVVRNFILSGRMSTRWGEFFAFMADRCEHAARVIAPSLAEGKCVLCDRYNASTLAYQVFSDPDTPRGTAEYMAALFDVVGLPRPDCVCLLDVTPDVARGRLRDRGEADSFDARGEDFFIRVRGGYDRIMATSPEFWMKIDASLPADEVFRGLTSRLASRFPCLVGYERG
jgi:dTMP kinase